MIQFEDTLLWTVGYELNVIIQLTLLVVAFT